MANKPSAAGAGAAPPLTGLCRRPRPRASSAAAHLLGVGADQQRVGHVAHGGVGGGQVLQGGQRVGVRQWRRHRRPPRRPRAPQRELRSGAASHHRSRSAGRNRGGQCACQRKEATASQEGLVSEGARSRPACMQRRLSHQHMQDAQDPGTEESARWNQGKAKRE